MGTATRSSPACVSTAGSADPATTSLARATSSSSHSAARPTTGHGCLVYATHATIRLGHEHAHGTSAQTANQATGGATQMQQHWGMTMPQQCASAQIADQTTFGATQAQQASAMSPTMTQQGAMTHTLPKQSAQPSAQQAHPNTTHFPTTTQTTQPFTNLFAPQQQRTTPTFNMTTTPSNPQSTTTAEALSLTHLAQNMDPTARRQLIQLLASHEPTMTSTGGSAAATLQQPQPPPQPPSQLNPSPQTQTHVHALTLTHIHHDASTITLAAAAHNDAVAV